MPSAKKTRKQMLASVIKKVGRAMASIEEGARAVSAEHNKIVRAAMARGDRKKLDALRSSLGAKK
ncbi:MAG: hypothetical protein AAB692_04455 [Patescibacteria group bacterium]